VIDQAELLSGELDVRFAALVHDLGKATTENSDLPSHPGHEQRGCKLIRKLAERLPVPRGCRDLGLVVAEFHTHCHRAFELRGSTIVKVLEKADAFRRPKRFERYLLVCEADARGRTGLENRDYPQANYLRGAFDVASGVDAASIATKNQGADIATAIRKARVSAVDKYCTTARIT
jgi:tRNA nucleotidyltransferase (CCA-adding enzyme)